jgi:shikimate kinase
VSPAGAGPRVVLVGPPGSGKTTVARELAERLGVAWRDTDADVEAAAGRTIADIFVDDGEPAFRELERQAVATALETHDGVLALGGGAVLDPRTEAQLAGYRVVFLDVRIADAARRIGFNRERPLLLGNPRAKWTALMEARRPVYERIASVHVETDGRTAAEVADAVLAELKVLEPALDRAAGAPESP